MNRISSNTLNEALYALGAFLEEANAEPESFVLIGGSALLALGLVSRTTRDADIMAGVDARKGLTPRTYGSRLTIHLPDRYDLIHLKLFAAVDQGMGRHVTDLEALTPTDSEMLDAARWVLTQDGGEVFPAIVRDALKQMGYERITHQL
jgi:hypothetical protein